MLFGKRGKSGLVALNLDLAQVVEFVKARLGTELPPPFLINFLLVSLNDPAKGRDNFSLKRNFAFRWGNIEFPLPFGRVLSPTESFIHSLDETTSASLKFTVLNPKGRIWTMVAGGGASVIYADTVGDLGYASELGNYAEEVLHYARVVIDCATANPDGRKRALLIGGGIANFTDVGATFNGIIRASREKVYFS
ncbi:ATP-citrate synthase alpha chain protein 2-like [Hibiscus syriacus]|uniref:ATP-citrate synthase alpha chain protein 2-like n=1 Tax=Hibiscus syriacus TaxID=106335 RepID=UPI0019206570|nr:ATP-citrate synthase alpha chain protein 2-like [Hibiscus syriacus]